MSDACVVNLETWVVRKHHDTELDRFSICTTQGDVVQLSSSSPQFTIEWILMSPLSVHIIVCVTTLIFFKKTTRKVYTCVFVGVLKGNTWSLSWKTSEMFYVCRVSSCQGSRLLRLNRLPTEEERHQYVDSSFPRIRWRRSRELNIRWSTSSWRSDHSVSRSSQREVWHNVTGCSCTDDLSVFAGRKTTDIHWMWY